MVDGRSLMSQGRNNKQRREDSKKRKEIFLAALEEHGTIKAGCEAAGVTRGSYVYWHKDDIEFLRLVEAARQSFGESLEGIALDRIKNPDKNRGSDVLLLGLLNANLPSKFRPHVAMEQDLAKELIVEWRKASRQVRRKDRKEEGGQDGDLALPVSVEQTLVDILERRSDSAKGDREGETG